MVVFKYHSGELARDCVTGRRRVSIREANNQYPNPPLSRDARLYSVDSCRTSLRRGLSEPRHRSRNVSIHSSPVVVALPDVPLRVPVSGFGCLAPPFHGGGPVLRNAPPTVGVDDAAPFLRMHFTLLCSHRREPQRLCPSRCKHFIVSRGGSLQNIQPHGTHGFCFCYRFRFRFRFCFRFRGRQGPKSLLFFYCFFIVWFLVFVFDSVFGPTSFFIASEPKSLLLFLLLLHRLGFGFCYRFRFCFRFCFRFRGRQGPKSLLFFYCF
jgi:hypothetical protein